MLLSVCELSCLPARHRPDDTLGKGLPITEALRPLIASQASLFIHFVFP